MGTGISSIANVSTRSSVASLTSAAGDSKVEKDRKTIAQNFDAFLSLLTTQLKNQSPTDPLDANQFTQQLVQFSSVEQQLKTNDLLSAMAKNFGGGAGTGGVGGKMNAASAASLIGVQVSADASVQKLTQQRDTNNRLIEEYRAAFPVKLQPNYTNYEVTVADESNNIVYSGKWVPPGTGDQNFVWDGRRTNGEQVDPTKSYNIQVSGQLNTNPNVKSLMSTDRTGVVSAVDLSGSEEMVTFGPFTVPMSKVKRVAAVTG